MPAYMDGFVRALETVLDDVAVAAIKQKLDTNADLLSKRDFQTLRISESVFGASERGTALGGHHSRAHQVIAETLDGLIKDIEDFREGVDKAKLLLDDADTTAGDTLAQRKAAVEQLEDANMWFSGDSRYEHARNHQSTQSTPQGSDR